MRSQIKLAHVLHTLIAAKANELDVSSPNTMKQIISWISSGSCLVLYLIDIAVFCLAT